MNYTTRSFPSSHDSLPQPGSRPRVLSSHVNSSASMSTPRQYAPLRTSSDNVSSSMNHNETPSSYRSTSTGASSTQHPLNGSGSHTSSFSLMSKTTTTTPSQLPSRISQKENNDTSLTCALTAIPCSLVTLDPTSQLMTEGLRLQQIWMEKDELKNLYYYFSCLSKLVIFLNTCQRNTEFTLLLQEKTRTLVDKVIPLELTRLRQRLSSLVTTHHAMNLDILFLTKRLQDNMKRVSDIRDKELSRAQTNLILAKQRRQYNQDLENVAAEILTKKPQQIYQKELQQEKLKLRESNRALTRWQRIAQVRKTQVEGVLLHMRDMLQSLKDPTFFFNLMDDSQLSLPTEQSCVSDTVPKSEPTLSSAQTCATQETNLLKE